MSFGRRRSTLRARLHKVAALRRGARRGETPQEWAAALGATLVELGPVPVAFARYLAWRPDIQRLVCCEELGSAPSPSPLLPARQLERSIEDALGIEAGEAFAHLDPEVVARDTLQQWHRGELSSGQPVLVQVPRPDVAGSLDRGMEVLAEVCDYLSNGNGDGIPWLQLLDDFRGWVARRLDLSGRRRAWAVVEKDPLLQDAWAWPTLVEELSHGGLLVVEGSEGRFLDEALHDSAGSRAGMDLARRVCVAWLELAAFGGLIAEGIARSDLLVLADDRLVLLGGAPAMVDEEDVQGFFDSVTAVALGHPDAACRALLRLTVPPPGGEAVARLRARLRQASAVRDGGLGRDFRGVRLAETLFVYWRLLWETGYEGRQALKRLATGMASLEALVRGVTPPTSGRDVLAEAVVDLQVMRGAAALRRALGPVAWRGRLEEALPLASDLPARVEAWLDRRTPTPREPPEPVRKEERSAALAVVLALLALVVVAASRLEGSVGWVENLAAGLCLALGAGAIWVAWGRRSTIHRR